jgi:hypothetical protein
MIKKIMTGGTYAPNGFNITANLCCGDAVKPANCTKELTANAEYLYKSIKVEGVEYTFPAPVLYGGLQVAINAALTAAGYTIDTVYSPISVTLNTPATTFTVKTDKTNIDMLILRSVSNGDFPFTSVCPEVNLADWTGNSTERVFLGFQNFTGDGSVVTLTPTSAKVNLAEINFLGGDGTYTLDGSNPTSSATAQTGTDDVQFEVEEKTGIAAIKLSAPAGVTISVLYYYRPAGFNA